MQRAPAGPELHTVPAVPSGRRQPRMGPRPTPPHQGQQRPQPEPVFPKTLSQGFPAGCQQGWQCIHPTPPHPILPRSQFLPSVGPVAQMGTWPWRRNLEIVQ